MAIEVEQVIPAIQVDYPRLVSMIQDAVNDHVPVDATVIVVSKGDDDLLRLGDRVGWHFPQTDGGQYVGHHPRDSRAAAEALEELRARGGQYLVFPSTAFWWLDYYRDFHLYLDSQYRGAFANEFCIIYDLGERSWLSRQVDRFRKGFRFTEGSSWGGSGKGRSGSARLWRGHHRTVPTVPPFDVPLTLPKPGGNLRIALEYPETLPLSPPDGAFDRCHMDLHWVLPDFDQGMGGPMAIFRFIRYLEQFGHKNTIWLRGGSRHGDAAAVREYIRERFTPVEAAVDVLGTNTDQICGDAVIATHCWTAYPVRTVRHVRERFYFVQDFEPMFYPMGAEYLLSEATYRFGFSSITSSNWLEQILRDRYGARTSRFTYAYDPDVYYQNSERSRDVNSIAFYARTKTARRAVELGLMALELVAARIPSLKVQFFGGSMGRLNVPYQYEDHGILDEKGLAVLYRTATIGVVFSCTNYSLIPHEMMACGLPVVEIDAESTRADFPAEVVALASPTPDGIAAKIEQLLRDAALRNQQAQQALAYVGRLSWEQSARQIEAALIHGIQAKSRSLRAGRISLIEPVASSQPPETQRTSLFAGPIVFTGQSEYYRSVYYDLTSTGKHFEFPYTSADQSALRDLPQFARDTGAKVCVIFRPEWMAPFSKTVLELKALGVKLIGYSTEPVPQDGIEPHADQLLRLNQLKMTLEVDYDLIVHYDAASLGFLKQFGFQHIIAHPLPVSRKLFFPEDRPKDFDVCFLGKSTPHRERMLAPLKMRFSTVHVAHGLCDEEARILMNRSKVVLNLHSEQYSNFESRVVQALFCQRPVVSELLTGDVLLPDRDYIRADSTKDLCDSVAQLLQDHRYDSGFTSGADLSVFAMEALLEKLETVCSTKCAPRS